MEGLYQNQTLISYTEFVLFGFPGVLRYRKLLIIPFLIIYITIVTGNSIIIHRIYVEKSLQSPMYFLIALLFAVNISCTTTIIPKFLLGLSFNMNHVTLTGCLMQMFFIYSISGFESGIILSMALDRYVAICRPLRYYDIMTKCMLVQLTVIGLARSTSLAAPVVILTSTVQFCRSNIILNFVCENMGLMNLACGDIYKQQVVGLIFRIFLAVVDISLLLLSYSSILYIAMKIAVGKSRHKALHTCGIHLLVAMLAYMTSVLSSITNRMQTYISHDVQNLFSAIYLMTPATINPVIYGLGMNEIRRCLTRSWNKRNTIFSSSLHIHNKT